MHMARGFKTVSLCAVYWFWHATCHIQLH